MVFIGSEALAGGLLTRDRLRRHHDRLFPDVYHRRGTDVTLRDRTVAGWLWSGRTAVVAGSAAAALHGARWVAADAPIELIGRSGRPPDGIVVRNETLAPEEITRIAGIPVTTVPRTAFDLGRHLRRGLALARLDALMRAIRFRVEDIAEVDRRHPGARGVRGLRRVLPLVDGGAASPRESWLRLLIVDAGLPAPRTQIPVQDPRGLLAMLDMGWEEFRVAAEYDGDQHRTDRRRYVWDQRRARLLADRGWQVVRVIKEDDAADVVSRVRGALESRVWRAEIAATQPVRRDMPA